MTQLLDTYIYLYNIHDNMNNENKIIIKCSSGHEIKKEISKDELDWEIVEADEREMGTEFLHEAELPIECEQCDEEFTVTLRIWEYPEGILNMQDKSQNFSRRLTMP